MGSNLIKLPLVAALLTTACMPPRDMHAANAVLAQQAIQTAKNGNISLAHMTYGNPNAPAIILLNGVGISTQFEGDGLTRELVTRGFRVVLMDNRDSGKSSRVRHAPDEAGDNAPAYALTDMAADVKAVLDHQRIEAAHVLGVSLGGMIGQVFASQYPSRTLSLISVSSTSGKAGLPFGPAIAALQESPAADSTGRAAQVRALYLALEGTQHRMSESELSARIANDLAHDDPAAAQRQGAAATASGDRTQLLNSLRAPTLVIHGSADPLFPIVHGNATAAAVPVSDLRVIEGMGHLVSDEAAAAVADSVKSFVDARK